MLFEGTSGLWSMQPSARNVVPRGRGRASWEFLLRRTRILGLFAGLRCSVKARNQALGSRERVGAPKTCRGLCLLVVALSSCKKLHVTAAREVPLAGRRRRRSQSPALLSKQPSPC